MKAAVLCAVCSVLAITLSQPTYEPEQKELCEGVCQQQDLKTLQNQFMAQFTAIKNEMSQLKEQVNSVRPVYNGGFSGNPVNLTELPGGYPTSPSWFIRPTHYHRLNGSSSPVLTATCLSYGTSL